METPENTTPTTSREIVTPGMTLSTDPSLIPGRGAIRTEAGEIISLFVGFKETRGKYMNVVPLNGLYNPQMGDKVIARVIGKTPVKFLMDINSKYLGILKPMDAFKRSNRGRGYGGRQAGTYRVKEEGDMQKLKMGDQIICKVLSGSRISEPDLTALGQDLGIIESGMVISIPATKIPRVIGKKGSMIALLKSLLHSKVFVAQNGRIWIKGKTFEHERLLIDAIHKIEREAHTSGLTDRIKYYITEEKKKRGIE
ncbi:Exosome complex component Rrp4 [Candidatus Lokiarchaeum ossiferum]|uniref:Exosome complex component Rrp4 n=1 Tax=Candidatus Lokiarchaeum ossiferum TaxID=2951803 RepID=A0ABY6HS72_9ARCH|nr:Exosome complex component Rrp4 [Candidatus Lokiarchaeum sp. B-35]